MLVDLEWVDFLLTFAPPFGTLIKERKAMKNAGKTISQILSKSLVGKTILKIDEDESLLGRKICKAELMLNQPVADGIFYVTGVMITVAAKCHKTEEKRFLPFDQDNKLVLRD